MISDIPKRLILVVTISNLFVNSMERPTVQGGGGRCFGVRARQSPDFLKKKLKGRRLKALKFDWPIKTQKGVGQAFFPRLFAHPETHLISHNAHSGWRVKERA